MQTTPKEANTVTIPLRNQKKTRSAKAGAQAAQPQFSVPPLQLPPAPVAAARQPSPARAAAPPATPAPAADVGLVDDGDLIEKEWVNKAKEIVAGTRDDPYKQSEELTVFKADYMKKRYDKHIKLGS